MTGTDLLDQLVTTDQAAQILDLSSARVRQLSTSDPRFPDGYRLGATVVYWRQDICRYADIERPANYRRAV